MRMADTELKIEKLEKDMERHREVVMLLAKRVRALQPGQGEIGTQLANELVELAGHIAGTKKEVRSVLADELGAGGKEGGITTPGRWSHTTP